MKRQSGGKWHTLDCHQRRLKDVLCSTKHTLGRYCPWFELDLYLVIITQPTRWWHFKMNDNWMGSHMKMIHGLSLCLLPGKTVKKKKDTRVPSFERLRVTEIQAFLNMEVQRQNDQFPTEWSICTSSSRSDWKEPTNSAIVERWVRAQWRTPLTYTHR